MTSHWGGRTKRQQGWKTHCKVVQGLARQVLSPSRRTGIQACDVIIGGTHNTGGMCTADGCCDGCCESPSGPQAEVQTHLERGESVDPSRDQNPGLPGAMHVSRGLELAAFQECRRSAVANLSQASGFSSLFCIQRTFPLPQYRAATLCSWLPCFCFWSTYYQLTEGITIY